MLNHMDNPADMLAWLSERNHHIPLEDLAFMLASNPSTDFPEEMQDYFADTLPNIDHY